MSTDGKRSDARGAARIGPLLDRPEVILQAIPLGAVYVVVVQLMSSAGPQGVRGIVGLAAVVTFYLAQSLLLLRRPRWAHSARALVFLCSSPFAALLANCFLVDPLPALLWVWLIAPVLMSAAYLCRPRHLAVACVFAVTAGMLFMSTSGIRLGAERWLVLVTGIAWALPCLLTWRVIGNLRQDAQQVQALRTRDPLTRVLNRHGLDEGYGDLLRAVAAGEDPSAELAVLLVDLDDFKRVGERLGNTVADAALAQTAQALARAFRRDHLVARLRGDTFVVVTTHPAQQLAPVLLSEVRRVNLHLAATASIGAIGAVPAGHVPADRLGSLILLAEGQLAEAKAAGGDRAQIADFDVRAPLPGPIDVATPEPMLPSRQAATVTEREPETGLLGVGLSVTAVLAMLVPHAGAGSSAEHTALVAGGAVLAAAGVLLAAGWLRHGAWQVAGIVLAFVVTALAVSTASTSLGRLVALVLVPFPAYLTSLTMRMRSAVALTLVLPVSAGYALSASTATFVRPAVAFSGILGFSLVTCALALWVRRVQDVTRSRLVDLARTDPGTGLLSREGLVEHYRSLPAGTEVSIVYLDVDDMARINAQVGQHGGDTVLRRVAVALHEAVAPDGAAARMGGDEFVLLVPGPMRSAPALRRLGERLAAEEVPVTVSLGQAFGTVDEDTSLWRLMARADEALLLNRARDRRSGARGPRVRPGAH